MPDQNTQDKVTIIDTVQALIANYLEEYSAYDSAAMLAEIKRIQKQLETRKQRLLNPQPKAHKPKVTLSSGNITNKRIVVHFEPDDYQNSKPKTGRNNR